MSDSLAVALGRLREIVTGANPDERTTPSIYASLKLNFDEALALLNAAEFEIDYPAPEGSRLDTRPLAEQWEEIARAVAQANDSDRTVHAEAADLRVTSPRVRRVVVGGVVDGRAEKPGVLLVSLTDEGDVLELGVSAREHAEAIIAALRGAWPGVGGR